MVTELSEFKMAVIKCIEADSETLIEMSRFIHANPEMGFHEIKAVAVLTEYLKRNGYTVESNIANLSTAFKAVYGDGRPRIALLAEYDALPEIGHACGHNIIGVAAAGAAVAAKCVVDKFGGLIAVIGTPAEEIAGGKINMVRNSVFSDFDVAMMIHPGSRNTVLTQALACIGLDIEFFGKAAHAAAYPELGINALDAMILSFNAIGCLRQQIKGSARIHGIVTNGGYAPNIIPEYTSASFLIRATTMDYLEELKKRVLNCFEGASISTGVELKYRWADQVYEPMKNNRYLAELLKINLEILGRNVESMDLQYGIGSTDMGNVSQVVPAIHPSISITDRDIHTHTMEFCKASASELGDKGLLDGAKALAMTIVDILVVPEHLRNIRMEFDGGVANVKS